MKRCIVIPLLLLQCIHSDSSYSAQATYTIDGVVLEDGTERPLPHVRVVMDTLTNAAYTDDQGHFSLLGSVPGRFRLVPTLEGYVYARPIRLSAPRDPGVWIQIAPGEHLQNIRMNMMRGGVVTGRVLDPNGLVIPTQNGTVGLMQYRYDEYGVRKLSPVPGATQPNVSGSFTRMDDRGVYRLFGLPSGDYILQITGVSMSRTFFPGTSDESKAVPIHVAAGEEVNNGTVTAQRLPQAGRLNLKLEGAENIEATRGRVVVGTVQLIFYGKFQPEVLANGIPKGLAAGHYPIQVFINSADRSVFGNAEVDLGSSDVDFSIVMKKSPSLITNVQFEDETGKRTPVQLSGPGAVTCSWVLDGSSGTPWYFSSNCGNAAVIPGLYEIRLQGLAPDVFVRSIKSNGKESADGRLSVDDDANVEVILANSGAVVSGIAKSASGMELSDAIIAIVPDPPLRDAGMRYRSVISDVNGRFELRGVAPGDYHLFAWEDLPGAAFRNADFMKKYDEKGTAVHIE